MQQIPRRKALVLGERSTSCIIAGHLEHEGFDPVFQEQFLGDQRLPSLADPNSLMQLRTLLKAFAGFAGHSGIVHPGVTAWAERSELPIIAEDFGLAVVCPPAKILSLFSNKLNLLLEAKKLGVPNAILSFDPIHTTREIEDFIQSTGQKLPFVLKAVKGRGSTSLFVAKEQETLKQDLSLWVEQLRRNVGEVILFAEKYVDGARHLVVPFSRFQDGRIWTFPLTDISLQCRYRKVVEFCPARQVTPEVTRQLIQWTRLLAREFGYVGVGAFEFLVDGSSAYLIEGLARLNAGFHLWEGVAGTSAVAWQIAALDFYTPPALPEIDQIKDSHEGLGFGISLRIYAEDSTYHLPQPGYIHEVLPLNERMRNLIWPSAQNRVNPVNVPLSRSDARAEYSLNYSSRELVSSFDSGIIGLFFAYGSDRSEVVSLVREMIFDFWIVGTLQTNQKFLFDLLQHPWIEEEIFYAGFIDDEYVPDIYLPEELKKLFLAVGSYLPEVSNLPRPLETDVVPSKWFIAERRLKSDTVSVTQAKSQISWLQGPVYWDHEGRTAFDGVLQLPELSEELPELSKGLPELSEGQLLAGQFPHGQQVRVSVFPAGDYWLVRIGFWFSILKRVPEGRPKRGAVLKALNSGRIHAILFLEGATVLAHDPLLTLEAFGVLVPHALPVDVRIEKWRATAEDQVLEGQELAHLIVV